MPDAISFHGAVASRFDAAYARSPAFRERHDLWTRTIAERIRPGMAVLDAGCGSGIFAFAAAAAGADVTAIDGSAEMIALCRDKMSDATGPVDFSVGRIEDIANRPAASFDAILCSSVLEYVAALPEALAQFARLLRPGGQLLLSMPNAESLYRRAERIVFRLTGRPGYYAFVRHVVTADAMAGRLGIAGFAVEPAIYYADPPLAAGLAALIGGARRRKSLFMMIARRTGDGGPP